MAMKSSRRNTTIAAPKTGKTATKKKKNNKPLPRRRKTATVAPTGQWEYSYKTWPMSGNNGWRLVAIHHEFRGNKVVEIWGRPV